jgi:hypothetical protein
MKHPPKESARTPAKPLPSGQERMKRKAPTDLSLRPQKFEFDPKKAYTVEQLAEIGAITLKWNQIEAHIDFIGSHILFSKTPLWLQIATDKALSMKGKLALLKECLKRSILMDDKAKNCVYAKGIGAYIDESRSNYQILVSLDALTTLYNILCSLLLELREIDLLFRIETDAQRPGRLDRETGDFHTFDDDYLKANILPENTKRILKLQDARKELQKLPQFPDADLVRSLNEQEDT